jgi:hypothetical protein
VWTKAGLSLAERQLLLVCGIAAVVAAAALGLGTTGPPATSMSVKCAAEESEDSFTGVCVPKPAPSVVEITTSDFAGVPEVDGVPCTGGNSYECIGLAEEWQGPTPSPSATLTAQGPPPSATEPAIGQELTSSPLLPPPPSP